MSPVKGLPEKDWAFISKHIKRVLPENFTLYIFGSRSRGTHQAYSDLDLCCDYGKPIPRTILQTLDEIFSDSDLPYKVDFVDFHALDNEFQKHILVHSKKIEF